MSRLLSLLLLFLPAAAWGQSRSFQNPELIPTAGDPAAMATGDWNRDGKPDIAYIDSSATPSLHILLGNGNGTFSVGQTVALAAGSCAYYSSPHGCYLAQADVNGDGIPDFVFLSTVGSSGSITVLMGNGDGTFTPPLVTAVPTSDFDPPYFMTVPAFGDFNKDGKLDIAFADYYGYVWMYTGDGAGHFTEAFHTNTSPGYPYAVYAGDFNHDGNLDMLVLGVPDLESSNAQVYYGTGTGSFTSGPSYTLLGKAQYADINADGIPDLVGSSGTNAWVMLGESNGTFAASQQVLSTLGTYDGLAAVADVNGDGIPDLIFNTAAGMKTALGEGNLNFAQPATALAGNVSIITFVAAKFDGGQVDDLALGTAGGIVYFAGSTTAAFGTASVINTGTTIQSAIGGDFNNDGKADLLLLGPSDKVQTWLGSASGTLTQGPSLTLSAEPTDFGGAAVADLDGDGNLDVAFDNGTLQILYGKGDGSFTLADTGLSVPAGSGAGDVFATDLNKDGKKDLLGVIGPLSNASFSSYYELAAYLNMGNRTFSRVVTALPVASSGSLGASVVGVADVNHDGIPDALVYEPSVASTGLAGIQIMLGNGDGTFRAGGVLTVTISSPGHGITYVGDLDGDGNADFLVNSPNAAGTDLSIYYGDGAGGFSSPQTIRLSENYGAFSVADINQDGAPDLVLSSQNLIAVIYNLGSRNYSSEAHYVAGNEIAAPVVADINGDGYPDIFVDYANYVILFPTAAILLNQPASSGGPHSQSVQMTVNPSPSTVAYNQGCVLTATVTSVTPNQPSPTGNVQFAINGQIVGISQLQSGTATLNVSGSVIQTFPSGQQSVTAAYTGDTTYAAGSANSSINILAPVYATASTLTLSPAVIQAGQFATLTDTLTAPVVVPNGTVTFYDGQTILGQALVQKGTAVLQTNLLSLGTNNLTAVYQGYVTVVQYGVTPATFQPSSSATVPLTVNSDATSTALTSSSTSLQSGTVLTLTATVTSSAPPFGGVTFFDGSTPLGTIALSASGTAVFSTVSLASGQHSFSAAYIASGPFAPSTSALVPVSIHLTTGPVSNVVIRSVGATTTGAGLQVAVSVLVPSAPSGAVTLIEDNQIVGTASVSPATGQASFLLPNENSGTHRIYASYSGDPAAGPSASPLFLTTDYTSVSDFSLSISSAVDSAANSLAHPATISVGSVGNWTGTVELSCSVAAANGYACSFSPASVTGPGISLLTFTPLGRPKTRSSSAWLALLFLAPLFSRRRRSLLLGALAVTLCIGCSVTTGSSSVAPYTTVTVQALSGATVHSAQILVR